MKPTPRKWIWVLGLAALLVAGCSAVLKQVGGAYSHPPEEMETILSDGAKALVAWAYGHVGDGRLRDYHVHVVGVGAGNTGAEVNPKMLSWLHPISRLKAAVYMNSSGVTDLANADRDYMERLTRLAENTPGGGKFHLLAFDRHYNADGTVNAAKTELYIPNDYVMALARQRRDLFVPVISVHPYRRDAVAALEKWAAQGAKFIKWLPNAQGIDASDPAIDPYYETMKTHNMVLLTHVGKELAVESGDAQALGNPLLFRRPLDRGVTVIMAHGASLGDSEDLDNPGDTPGARVDNFDLFMRLMDDPRYGDTLFGEISAITQFNRVPGPLLGLLERGDLHHRLVNGSDYPLPAINFLFQTRQFVNLGMITKEEQTYLREIYGVNPLIFDYVLKRILRHPETGAQFPSSVFQTHPRLQ
ncbi:MAG: amidohydrolase [Alphaproteobacteria bacterium]|nr:amidohydrolase [Alphaproteobacteria bacterium]